LQPTPEDYSFSRLIAYAAYQWPGYKAAKHHRLIARHLEAVERGEITRLMISMPPRHGKSMLASEFFPAWYLGRNPSHYVIAATYAQDLADDFGRKVRDQIADASFQAIFPGCRLKGDSKSSKRFHVTQQSDDLLTTDLDGAYFAAGIGGPLTGRGAHLLLIDDPVKNREEAESATIRQRNKDWYTSTAYTRLMPDAKVVIIQTRWHDDDLAGWQLREHGDENWVVLSLPAIAETDGDILGRKTGEPLWDNYPIESLDRIKRSIGSRDWTALYQQRPAPSEGGIIKADWFKRYDQPQEKYQRIVQSWDTAIKAGQLNDPSVCTTWGERVDGYDLLQVLVRRLEYPDLKRAVISQADSFAPDAILIEDKASGQQLLQDLRRETKLPLIAITPIADKITRASGVSAMVEAGKVSLPKHAAWLTDYESEMLIFPNATHDDQVDSTTQFLAWIRTKMNGATPSIRRL
jgi:predicted phage terminase large subunit-like protein